MLIALLAGCQESAPPEGLDQTGTATDAFTRRNFESDRIPDAYIIVLNNNISSADVGSIAATLGSKHGATPHHLYRRAVKGFSATMSATSAAAMARDSRVHHIEPDYTVSVEPTSATQKPGTGGSGQVTPWGVSRVGGPISAPTKTVWIIDTGIDLDNPDLNVDVARSVNFAKGKDSPDDKNGHGTHVAGIIGARNNSIDVVGVAPNALLVSVRVLGSSGSGSVSDIIAGVDYVAANAAEGDVVNMSLEAPASEALDASVRVAASSGIKFAVAAGNDGVNALGYSPARVLHSNVYTVSAIDLPGCFAQFSNFGNPPVDFAAPGVGIESLKLNGGRVIMDGTSMAAPHVAALLALGSLNSLGTACADPDNLADPIAHY
jgi:subtilisin family serine protease